MIIQFSISNYRCFKERQTLTMAASGDKTLSANCIVRPLPGRSGQRWLKGVGLYGANASGKSTMLNALSVLRELVLFSAKTTDANEPVDGIEPFALAPEMLEVPTAFAIIFVAEAIQYEYRVATTSQRIWHESLRAFPHGREQLWFIRDWNPESREYIWSPERPSGFKRDPQLENYTLSNMLFLSKAVANNKTELAPVFRWFKDTLVLLNRVNIEWLSQPSHNFSIQKVLGDSLLSTKITQLLQSADLGITKIGIKDKTFASDLTDRRIPESDSSLDLKKLNEALGKIVKELREFIPEKMYTPVLGHRGAEGRSVELPWNAESLGTQRLFALAGPWFDILQQGRIICIDELENSMHPLMVRALLQHFFNENENKNGAQILFTTHNPLLLDTDLLRRDQVWFTEKDDDGAAHLYPLTDYSPRKNESLIRGYLSGRYGGIPFIPASLTQPAIIDAAPAHLHKQF